MPIITGTRVKQTSTTTGTGSYTLVAAPTGFNSFGTEFGVSATSLFPYVAYDEVTNDYECGVGNLTGASTLARVAVYASTNGDAPVNWAAGQRTLLCTLAGYQQFAGRHNFSGTAPPTTSNNYLEGYSPGSLWCDADIAKSLYVCVFSGDSAVPNAAWVEAGSQRGWVAYGSVGTNVLFDGQEIMGVDPWGSACLAGICARPNTTYSFVFNAQSATQAYAFAGEAQVERIPIVGPTTNATPRVLQSDGYNNMEVPEACIRRYTGTVLARQNSTGDAAQWTVSITVQRIAAGNVTAVIAASVTNNYAAAGAATWTIGCTVNTTNQSVDITATGEAAKNIVWYGNFEVIHLGVGVAT